MPSPRRSRAWSIYLRGQYRLIRILDPLIRTVWRAFGLGNVVELRVAGRRTGRERRTLVGLLRDGSTWFVGHPNGDAAWTQNLAAAGGGTMSVAWSVPMPFVARLLEAGPERDRAIAATWQHVFPGNVVYRLARRHILAVGVYFVLELIQPDAQDPVATVEVSPSRQHGSRRRLLRGPSLPGSSTVDGSVPADPRPRGDRRGVRDGRRGQGDDGEGRRSLRCRVRDRHGDRQGDRRE